MKDLSKRTVRIWRASKGCWRWQVAVLVGDQKVDKAGGAARTSKAAFRAARKGIKSQLSA